MVSSSISNPKTVLIFIVAILILAVIGVVSAYQFYYRIPTPTVAQWDCFAIATTEVDYCKQLERASFKFTSNELSECYNDVHFRKAVFTVNSALCENIVNDDGFKTICKAIINKDAALCAGIGNTAYKNECEAIVNNDIGKCDSLQGSEKVSCQDGFYTAFGVIKQDVSYCEKIRGLEPNSEYYRSFVKCRGGATGDVRYCTGRNLGNMFFKSDGQLAQYLSKKMGWA